MAATVAIKVAELLDAAFEVLPVGVTGPVTGYQAYIPGSPTPLYWVLYCGEPVRSNSTVDGLSRDANGRFQVTVAASRPNSAGSPLPFTNWLTRTVLDALVDVTVDDVVGLGLFTIQQDYADTVPIVSEVVADRITVEHALLFTYLADRT